MHVLLLLDFFQLGILFSLVSAGCRLRFLPSPAPVAHTWTPPSSPSSWGTASFGWKQSSVFALLLLCKHYSGQRHAADFAYFSFPAHLFFLELIIAIFMIAYKLITDSTSHSASYLSLSQSLGQYTPCFVLPRRMLASECTACSLCTAGILRSPPWLSPLS